MTNKLAMTERVTPVVLLSGFLGSGKTTLLGNLLQQYKEKGLRPAVVMNEIGDTNLDGQLVDEDVPLAELLSGCICCSMKGDLGLELYKLLSESQPDVIIIESTGGANPMETIDAITEASMYKTVELTSIITVVDGPELLRRHKTGKGRTFKLMKEQIRCATHLLLNKSDKLMPEEVVEAQQLLRDWNSHASIMETVRCQPADWDWLTEERSARPLSLNHEKVRHDGNDEAAEEKPGAPNAADHHHSHSHVMVLTHYWSKPIDSESFEVLLHKLPDNIYRAKGILTFRDTPSRFLFQYAFKETDFMRIEPQGEVRDVAVFIGEHFSKDWLMRQLERLEQEVE
ncbi:GTP-binding protein [Paenibacillus sp. J5C_2022]|uniref:CobW family GTP-binding protein n=1 Tax=Paenibacillus sp. J5C2022 TaxID=2977129 RepID=UPI0021D1FFD7|nr:CobW family GTP-binding protein [Paenibacillus sp. J5C2022]MCU6713078.1 GTP-binding protein [Paenibacillus sp. J5C2022]